LKPVINCQRHLSGLIKKRPGLFLAVCLCFFGSIPVIKSMIFIVLDPVIEQFQQFFITWHLAVGVMIVTMVMVA
jgi:hypothetical protein